MIYAYVNNETKEISSIVYSNSGDGIQEITGYSLVSLGSTKPSLPAWLGADGETVIPVPARPSSAHTWNWTTKTWDLDLTLAKAQAWARIKQARDACEFGLFTWSGHTFDGDEVTRGRLVGALAGANEAIANAAPWTKPWKLANNTVVELSAQDMIEVVRAHYERMEFAHATAGVLAYFIESSTALEQLEAIQWPA